MYLGRTHSSTAIHEEVIRGLDGSDPAGLAALDDLRRAAAAARDAVEAGDLAALGAAMQANTEGQRRLHPSLVGADAQRVIAAVAARGALGWKVNGAGGEGGSLAVLCPPGEAARAAIEAAIAQASSGLPGASDVDRDRGPEHRRRRVIGRRGVGMSAIACAPRRWLRLAAPAAVLLTALGCSGTPVSPSPALAGQYGLVPGDYTLTLYVPHGEAGKHVICVDDNDVPDTASIPVTLALLDGIYRVTPVGDANLRFQLLLQMSGADDDLRPGPGTGARPGLGRRGHDLAAHRPQLPHAGRCHAVGPAGVEELRGGRDQRERAVLAGRPGALVHREQLDSQAAVDGAGAGTRWAGRHFAATAPD